MESKDNEKVDYYLPTHMFWKYHADMVKYVDDGDKRVEDQLDQVNTNLQVFIESQKPIQETMSGLLSETKEMNKNLTKQVRRTEKLEDEQISINKAIKVIQDGLSQKIVERNKLLIGFGSILLGAGGLVPVLAQIFFR